MRFSFRRPSLGTKIILWSFVPTAIILSMVALTLYYAYQQLTEDFVLHRDEELTRLSASQVSSGFEEYVDRLNALARLPKVYEGTPTSKASALKAAENQLVFFDGGVYLLDNLGRLVASQPERVQWKGQDWSQRPYFQEVLEASEARFSDIVNDGPDGIPVIIVGVPILGEQREFKGMVLGMFRLDSSAVSPFYGTLIKQRIGGTGDAFLIDGNGKVIFASDFSQINSSLSSHPGAAKALSGKFDAHRTVTPDGRDIVISYAPVPRSSWRLIIEEDWKSLLEKSQNYGRFLLLLLALGVVIPSIVVMVSMRAITGPLNEFITAARNIANGDFNQTITVNTKDELEELAFQFNTMARQLQDLYSNLENRVADRTKELSAVNSVAEVVSRSLDLNRVLPDALAKTLEVMEMDAGAIFRLDPLSNQLVLVVEQGLNPDVRQLALDLPIEYSIVSEVMETRKPAARLLTKYPEGPVKAILHQAGVRLVVSIPLLSQEKVFGAINVLSFTDIYPTPEELSAAAAIGQQIGVAMENARLFAQTAAYAQAMEKARMAADEANASKSSFVANVSHELRTPLTSILGFASLVQKRLKERILPHTDIHDERVVRSINQVQENLHIIISESQRLTSLINDVLDLEKIEAGKMEWQMQRLQIEQVIELSIANTASLFEGSSLKLKSVITHELPEIIGDKDKLLQVMINLLSNAVKFTSRGQVTIRAELHNQKVIVSVSDTGIGITTEDLPKIFEKFKQVGDSLTAKPKGTGLGLPIVKEIVEHHGGQVWVESTPGIGSIFYFSLPAVGSRFIADPGDSLMLDPFVKDLSKHLLETQSTQNNDTFCILIVEEDPYIRKLLHEQMESERCQIVEAVDLSSAISSLNCSSPDLIILDKMMQDATDEEIGSFIKANLTFTHAPILLVMTDERDQDCYQIVVDSYFSRPRDLNHLIHETQFLMHQTIKGKKILIVDQDESRIKAIQTDLITQGFEVLTARDIPEGIIRASAYHPNLLVIESSLSVRNDPVKWDRFEKEMMGAFIMLYQLDVNPE